MKKGNEMQSLFALLLIGIAVFVSMSYIKSFHGKNVLPGATVEMKTKEVLAEEEKAMTKPQKTNQVESKYYVTENDTLAKISQRMYGTEAYTEKIAQYNKISDVNMIHTGDVLLIPIQE